ncbi:3-hydroxyacyl-CoA dehydrogenase NAD-binding domain-containing protein [Streptomyces halobius]|uniref:3-hydroxyacyl-CoA dehydrogenase NAD binding domain-containing protein n=1 Tax=Streptomyces halobius TaxID=2879846 RepID=A0ABY4M595_9ACTN|nr:3-hydroxyacyl-CoA dehydrogenase NAD-binding domain-containing protein [Streptomyces halobius]UQA91994.1 hypothetical protein K9S39_09155 [Streptomyces halobius]
MAPGRHPRCLDARTINSGRVARRPSAVPGAWRPGSRYETTSRSETSLNRAVAKGKLSEPAGKAALDGISLTPDIKELADRQLVIESINEDEAAKAALFKTLDRIVEASDALLASNTSSLPVMRLARATTRPQRVIGMHFFSPVPVLPLVELTGSLLTDETACDRAERFATEVLGAGSAGAGRQEERLAARGSTQVTGRRP